MEFIGMSFIFIVGIIVGTQVPLAIQAFLFVAYIAYMNSSSVKAMEIGALFPMIIGSIFFAGIVIGDLSYLIQTGDIMTNIGNPFIVKK